MKRIIILFYSLIILLFSGCQFSENIYIEEDGSGKMEFTFDGSEFVQMMGEKMKESDEERVDSTIVFKEFLEEKKDSIAQLSQEEQEKLNALASFSLHMLMDPETSEMEMNLFTEFSNVNELKDMFKAMNNMSNFQGKGAAQSNDKNNPFSSFGDNGSTDMKYEFDGKTFKRTAIVLDREAYEQLVDSMSQLEMMFGSSKYKLNYHFPKKIKSVSNNNALFSEDRKSVVVEYGFMDYLKNPEALNLEVTLED